MVTNKKTREQLLGEAQTEEDKRLALLRLLGEEMGSMGLVNGTSN